MSRFNHWMPFIDKWTAKDQNVRTMSNNIFQKILQWSIVEVCLTGKGSTANDNINAVTWTIKPNFGWWELRWRITPDLWSNNFAAIGVHCFCANNLARKEWVLTDPRCIKWQRLATANILRIKINCFYLNINKKIVKWHFIANQAVDPCLTFYDENGKNMFDCPDANSTINLVVKIRQLLLNDNVGQT